MKFWQVVMAVGLGLGLLALAQSTQRLILNGQVASTRVITVQGTAYVPVADVAKALGQSVVKVQGGFEIRAAGGANQLMGQFQGKVGDQILNRALPGAGTKGGADGKLHHPLRQKQPHRETP